MRKIIGEVSNKVDGAAIRLKNKARNYLQGRKEGGFETFVIILLLIAIGVALADKFKVEITGFMTTLFNELEGDVLNDFMNKPAI